MKLLTLSKCIGTFENLLLILKTFVVLTGLSSNLLVEDINKFDLTILNSQTTYPIFKFSFTNFRFWKQYFLNMPALFHPEILAYSFLHIDNPL